MTRVLGKLSREPKYIPISQGCGTSSINTADANVAVPPAPVSVSETVVATAKTTAVAPSSAPVVKPGVKSSTISLLPIDPDDAEMIKRLRDEIKMSVSDRAASGTFSVPARAPGTTTVVSVPMENSKESVSVSSFLKNSNAVDEAAIQIRKKQLSLFKAAMPKVIIGRNPN